MTIDDWLSTLDRGLQNVSARLRLPYQEAQAFDGDGWVWTYRDYLDVSPDDVQTLNPNVQSRVAEVQVRSRPDHVEAGLQLEIVASAWALKSRQAAWSRTHAARHVDPPALLTQPFTDWLAGNLHEAWSAAHKAADTILKEPDARSVAIDVLRNYGFAVRVREPDPGRPPAVSRAPGPDFNDADIPR